MSTTPADTITLMRGACQRVLLFLDAIEPKLRSSGDRRSQSDAEKQLTGLRGQLESVLGMPVEVTSFDDVAGVVMQAPGVAECFIQKTATLSIERIAGVSSGLQGNAVECRFRVFIQTGSKFHEASGPDLLGAVREAFTETKIALPAALFS